MDNTEGTAAPRLTDDGAKLLADVLSTRAKDRHNTLADQRNERRREADALRQTPPDIDKVDPPANVEPVHLDEDFDPSSLAKTSGAELDIVDRHGDLDEYGDPEPYDGRERRDNSGRSLRWALLVSLGVAIGLAISVASLTLIPTVTADTDTAQSEDITDSSSAEGDLTDETRQVPEVEVAGRQASQEESSESIVSSDDIEVSVYDTSPANSGVYSFALRLKNTGSSEELMTEDFTVRVEDEFGVPATTFSRFVHETLPVDSSALATVRAEQVGPGEQFVTVWYGDVLLDRILIENEE